MSRAVLAIAVVLLIIPARIALADDSATAVAHVSAGATLNTPVFVGDRFSTSDSSTEIALDDVTLVRVAPQSRISIADLTPGKRTMRLEAGTIELRLFANPPGVSVQTPSITVVAEQSGGYRIEAHADGATAVSVRSGRMSVPLPNGGALTVLPDMTLRASGTAANPDVSFVTSAPPDNFDAWNDARDLTLDRSLTDAHVSPILGASGLAGYGRWMNYSSYGSVWQPYAESGWAPYTQGSWIQTLFGPTWLSSEPWGWAPYHFGRWVFDAQYGWLWVPGEPTAPWAPALVSFLSLLWPNPFGLSPFGENIGWVPLAPGEFYAPWWGNAATPIVLATNPNDYANTGHLYNRPNFNYAATPNVRFVQSSIVGAPAHFNPKIHMNVAVSGSGGGGSTHAAPPPVRAAAPVVKR